MKKRQALLVALVLALLLVSSALGQSRAECGDVNDDGNVDISDLVYLIDYLWLSGPLPVDTVAANMDLCRGIDAGDIVYLTEFLYGGGAAPCAGITNCTLQPGTSVSLDDIDGLIMPGVVGVGEPVNFYLRLTNASGEPMRSIQQGFKVYSPDGAEWNPTQIDTIAGQGMDVFNLGFFLKAFSQDGQDADTVAAGGIALPYAVGLPVAYDGVPLKISLGTFDAADLGKTICLDSCWFPRNGLWLWAANQTTSYGPSWDGPHCFSISEPPPAMITLDTVHGQIAEGVIRTEVPIHFDLRYTNNIGLTMAGIQNGFHIYSPDGAGFGTVTGDTLGPLSGSDFDMMFVILPVGDTIGFAGVSMAGPGMPDGFDDVPFRVSIPAIDTVYDGRTICIDSAFFPPGGSWLWIDDYTANYFPGWSGPHCFTVQHVEEPPVLIETSVDTLYYEAYHGVANCPPQSFNIRELMDLHLEYHAFPDTDNFIDMINYEGTTPGDIMVQTEDVHLMPPGTYLNRIWVGAIGAANSPKHVWVHLTVHPQPEAAIILDEVEGLYANHLVKAGREVTFNLRAVNFTGDTVDALSNAYELYSPTGTLWHTTTGDTLALSKELFSEVFIGYFSVTGSGADTVGFAGIAFPWDTGMLDGFNDIVYNITVGPIDTNIADPQICLDSSFYPPVNEWMWSVPPGVPVYPDWGGPHCFTVVDVPFLLDVAPDSLHFVANPGQEPVSYFDVTETSGDTCAFVCVASEPWIELDRTGGATPQTVAVGVNTTGMAEGIYEGMVWIHSVMARNAPLPVPVTLQIVEFVSADSLVIPSVVLDEVCGAVQPVMVHLTQPIKGATIPIEIPPQVRVEDISFDGLLTQGWNYNFTKIDNDSSFAFVALANSFGEMIPPGTTTVFTMVFNAGTAECEVPSYMRWDTTLMDDPGRALLFADSNNIDLLPGFDYYADSTQVPGYVPGDLTGDWACNIVDLTAMVAYLFGGGLPPCVLNSADVNGTCTGPNIADLTYLVDYLFQDGADPKCGCIGSGGAAPKIHAGIVISTIQETGFTTITLSSPIALRGVEVELCGTSGVDITSRLGADFDLVYHERGGEYQVGILDLDGAATLSAGEHRLMSLPGSIEIVSAVVSDIDHADFRATVTARTAGLPAVYALHQNYPNPFNPVTTIVFDLGRAGHATLEVYNVIGQKVATLVDGPLSEGEHTVTWDASGHASGVYMYRLVTGDFVETRKMILLK